MRTREKFYKNLSEFNIQENPSLEKVELKDIKTLNKLSGQLTNAIKKLDDSKIKSELGKFDKANADFNAAENKFDLVRQKLDDAEQKVAEAKKQVEKEEKEYLKFEKQYDKLVDKYNAAAKKVFNENDKYISNYNTAENIADKLEDAVIEVQQAAKKLGVNINVTEFVNVVVTFKNLQENPLNKLNFDY